jgi:hypothetical protein
VGTSSDGTANRRTIAFALDGGQRPQSFVTRRSREPAAPLSLLRTRSPARGRAGESLRVNVIMRSTWTAPANGQPCDECFHARALGEPSDADVTSIGRCARWPPSVDEAPQHGQRRPTLRKQIGNSARRRVRPGFGEKRASAAIRAGIRPSPNRAASACRLLASTRVEAGRFGRSLAFPGRASGAPSACRSQPLSAKGATADLS